MCLDSCLIYGYELLIAVDAVYVMQAVPGFQAIHISLYALD
jgi:hypothetical protein